MSAGGPAIVGLDDARAERLEPPDPRLRRVARFGLAAVGEVGRLAQKADGEPVEARLGHVRAA